MQAADLLDRPSAGLTMLAGSGSRGLAPGFSARVKNALKLSYPCRHRFVGFAGIHVVHTAEAADQQVLEQRRGDCG